ncbi:hypothetical protein Peur_073821 [Populus x canadensis]
MDSSSKELLHLVHKRSSNTSSNAVLYLRFRVFLPMCTVFLFFLPKLHFFIVCKRESQESHHQTEKPPTDGNYGGLAVDYDGVIFRTRLFPPVFLSDLSRI